MIAIHKESGASTANCHPERHPSPALRDEVESKDRDGVSSAMQPQGVLSMQRENALMRYFMLHTFSGSLGSSLGLRSGFRLAAQTPPKRLNFDSAPVRMVPERFQRRSAQDDSGKV